MVTTDKYLIFWDCNKIYYYNLMNKNYDYIRLKNPQEYIVYIEKIHNEMFLASNDKGNLLQTKIIGDNNFQPIHRKNNNINI